MIGKIKAFIWGGETRKHLFNTFLVYGFISLSIIVLKILIARLYGQEELGIFTYFFSVVSLVYLFTSFGLPEALTQVIIKNGKKLRSVLKYFTFYTVLSTIVFLYAAYIFLKHPNFDPGLRGFYWAVALSIIAYTLHYLSYSIFRGRKYFVSGSLYSLLNRIFIITFLVLFSYLSLPFVYFLFSMSAALLLATIASLPQLWKISDKEKVFHSSEAFLYLAFSLFLVQVSFYSLRFIDALTIKYLVDFSQLGLYSAYSSITNVIRLLGYVFPMVVIPMAAVSKFKLRESFRRIMYLLVPFVGLVLIGTYFLVPFLYGDQYQATWLPVALVFSSTLLIVYSYFNSIFVGENKFSPFYVKILALDALLSLIVNTILNLWFISLWGIIGAPIGTAVTILIKIVLNLYGIKQLRIKNGKEAI